MNNFEIKYNRYARFVFQQKCLGIISQWLCRVTQSYILQCTVDKFPDFRNYQLTSVIQTFISLTTLQQTKYMVNINKIGEDCQKCSTPLQNCRFLL